MKRWIALLVCLFVLVSVPALAAPAKETKEGRAAALELKITDPGAQGGSSVMRIVILMTVLAVAPSILLLMTAFVRIVLALHFLRQALGTPQMPPNQVVIGLALFLTFFVMGPTIDKIYREAWVPYEEGRLEIADAAKVASEPLKTFMLKNTREADLLLFVKMAKMERPRTPQDLSMRVIVPAFVISELRVGFQIGFLLFLPFLVVDLVVGSVLLSMGMMMLPPTMVSLPFKLLLFVLVDGWGMLAGSLVAGFH